MARGIMYVETFPSSPEATAEYHRWYETTHMPELLGIEGIVAARRYVPVDTPEGPFVAVYEIEADDLADIRRRLDEAQRSGAASPPVGLRLDPPPVVRVLELIAELT
jgi:hypothetical protein